MRTPRANSTPATGARRSRRCRSSSRAIPFGRYAQQAQLDLAWASYKEGERAEALVAVDRFIRLHPTHERLDYAFYLKGLINFNNREGLIARMAGQDLSERDQQASREAYEVLQAGRSPAFPRAATPRIRSRG